MELSSQLLAEIEDKKLVSASDLARIKVAIDVTGKRTDEVAVELGILGEDKLADLLPQFGVPLAAQFEPVVLPELPVSFLRVARVLPIQVSDGDITLGMVSPWDDFSAKAVQLRLGRAVIRQRVERNRFDRLFADTFGDDDDTEQEALMAGSLDYSGDLDVLKDAASDAPVVRFVNDCMRSAISKGASDIHLRALRFGAQLLFRVDGALIEQEAPPSGMLPAIISRLKIMANLDIAERRLPQDGRLRVNVAGSPVDLRISTMPHAHGEGAVLRILSKEVAASSFEDLGFSQEILSGLQSLVANAEGLLLVTGPTGSGKSTTLHVALRQLIRPGLNVVTVEDPIEYRIDGAAQVQVDEKIGLTFPKILRSLLRQDPDVVLIGEIRDGETAKIAVQAALTGHVVLATLHTNSAPAAIPRLIDMGVEPYLLAAVLRGVLAQRLVRRSCGICRGQEGQKGCSACGGRGVIGRIAVGELLPLNDGLTSALAASSEVDDTLAVRLRASGYRPMAEDAAQRVAAGEISEQDLAGALHAP
jgi:general secretion pathway protein E